MDKCDIKTGTCESSGGSHEQGASTHCESKCECGGACGGDPVVCAMLMWKCAFKTAMKETMVDILKPKIQKVMGPKLEKAADLVMEAMMTKWQSKIAEVETKERLKEKFRSLMTEGK